MTRTFLTFSFRTLPTRDNVYVGEVTTVPVVGTDIYMPAPNLGVWQVKLVGWDYDPFHTPGAGAFYVNVELEKVE